jgi:hypothetical protein
MSKAKDLLAFLGPDSDKIQFQSPVDLSKLLERRYSQIEEVSSTTGAVLDGIEYMDFGAVIRFSSSVNERKVVSLLNEEFSDKLIFRSNSGHITVEAKS